MADIFDQLPPTQASGKGDVFDAIAPQTSPPDAPGIRAENPTAADYLRRFLFGGPQGETALGRAFPSMSGAKITNTPTSQLPLLRFEELIPSGEPKPDSTIGMYGVPVPAPSPDVARGGAEAATGLTTGENLGILAGTAGLGTLGAGMGYSAALGRTANAALGAYFTYETGKDATAAMKQAYAAHRAGDDDTAARLLGFGSVSGLLAAAGALHTGTAVGDILKTPIPTPPLKGEVLPPEPKPGPEPLAKPAPQTIDVKPTAKGDVFDQVAPQVAPQVQPQPAQTPNAAPKTRVPKPQPTAPEPTPSESTPVSAEAAAPPTVAPAENPVQSGNPEPGAKILAPQKPDVFDQVQPTPKPATPQVNEAPAGTKYVLPSFVTAQYVKPGNPAAPGNSITKNGDEMTPYEGLQEMAAREGWSNKSGSEQPSRAPADVAQRLGITPAEAGKLIARWWKEQLKAPGAPEPTPSFQSPKDEESDAGQAALRQTVDQGSGQRVYVRFGSLPDGNSQNSSTRAKEAGLSVYPATRTPDGKTVLDLRGIDQAAFGSVSNRPAFEATGDVLDQKGGDGEPLLENAKLGKRLQQLSVLRRKGPSTVPYEDTLPSTGGGAYDDARRAAETEPGEVKQHPVGTRSVAPTGDPMELREYSLDDPRLIFNEPAKQNATVDKYADWIRAGHEPPAMSGIEKPNGDINILSGNHRRAAIAATGGDRVKVWVETPKAKSEENPITVSRDGKSPHLIDPARLEAGGDIREAYSADKIAAHGSKQTPSIRKPFSHDGALWVTTGISSVERAADGSRAVSATAYRVLPADQFNDTKKRKDGSGYHGVHVTRNGKSYVLVGPAVHFEAAPEAGTTAQPATETPKETEPEKTAVDTNLPHPKMGAFVDALVKLLENQGRIKDTPELVALAKESLGDGLTSGKYQVKDLYDALEVAVNRILANDGRIMTLAPHQAITGLEHFLLSLPTQTARTKQQREFQQFSTPPTLSYLAAKAANIQPGETVLEPSAGTGSLAVFAKAAGAKVETNELDKGRAAFLRLLGFEPTEHNAERIRDMRPDLQPDVVLMNPPFSASAGRLSQNQNSIGYKHVLSALKSLPEGGRLVAILGRGASFEHSTAAPFWKAIAGAGARVRANIGLDGSNYSKYGTTFDNRLIIIDRSPAVEGEKPIVGEFKSLTDAYDAIRSVIDSRASIQRSPEAAQPAGDVREGPSGRSDRGGETVRSGETGDAVSRPGRRGSGQAGGDSEQTGSRTDTQSPARVEPAAGSVESGEQPARSDARTDRRSERLQLDTTKDTAADELPVERDGAYEQYRPRKLRTGVPHEKATGTGLVETGAMAAIDPPDLKYHPDLPASAIDSGHITDAQLEAIAYAGQAHQEILPSGARQGFMVGDGTGVGKGTIAAGIALDNWNQGRRRILWLSMKGGLIKQAQRDLDWVESGIKTKLLNDWKMDDPISHEGVVFATYNTLHRTDPNGRDSRLAQLQKWNPDVILMDESHAAKNAVPAGTQEASDDSEPEEDEDEEEGVSFKNGRMQLKGKASKAGESVLDLDRTLPDSRVTYFSATAFTDTRNLGYATRLGLWGPGTSFPRGFRQFNVEIDAGGMGMMELVAKEMKARGAYVARNMSFKGVTFREAEAPLTAGQKQMYDAAVTAWQTVLAKVDDAIGVVTGEEDTQSKGLAKMRAVSQFWSANQRFYRSLITAMKVPAAIEATQEALDAGHSVFLDLVSTGEAETQRQLTAANESGNLSFDDIDLSAKQTLIGYVKNSFPINLMEDYEDEETGAKRSRPVLDADGRPAVNQEALAMREALLKTLDKIQLPQSPLDQFIDYFGPDQVAEVSGRKSRITQDPKTGQVLEVKRVKPRGASARDVNDWERQQFQEGKKRIAIASGAGGTGFDFHSDKRNKNQQRRTHIVLEPSWSADQQMQKFGRTHRTNQANAPEYVLIASDLGGEKRFISAIASRIASLGALTRGERKAGGGAAEMLAKYNIEGDYGQAATTAVLRALWEGDLRTIQNDVTVSLPAPSEDLRAKAVDVLKQLGAVKETKDGMTLDRAMPTKRFLNRLLNTRTAEQRELFNYFMQVFEHIIDTVKKAGAFDEGTIELKALSSRIANREHLRENATGGATHLTTVDGEFPVEQNPWSYAVQHAQSGDRSDFNQQQYGGLWRNKRSGKLWMARKAMHDATDQASGAVVPTMSMIGPREGAYSNVSVQQLRDNYERISNDQARSVWEQSLSELPKSEHRDIHLITGSVLPAWEHIRAASGGDMKAVRVSDEKGQGITGIQIPESAVGPLRDRLRGAGDFSPNVVLNRIWSNGERIPLKNATLSAARVMGERAIVIQPATKGGRGILERLGIQHIETASSVRFYLPYADEADPQQHQDTLDKLKEVLDAFPPGGKEEASSSRDEGAKTETPPVASPEPVSSPSIQKKGPAAPAKSPVEAEVLRILGRGEKDEFELAESFGFNDKFSSPELKEALRTLVTNGDVERTPERSYRRVKSTKGSDNGVVLGSGLGALQPFFERFMDADVKPTAKKLGELVARSADDLKKVFAPAARAGAEPGALSVRHRASELQRSTDVAEAIFQAAAKYFDSQPAAANFDFIDRIERGVKQRESDLQQFADTMRKMLDQRRTQVQALGTGKLENFIENYFPHLWEHPQQARQAFADAGKRPLQGSKSFLKKRSIQTFADGIELGLTPISENPVELLLGKVRQMDKYLSAHRILGDLKSQGLLRFKRATKPMPEGYTKINDDVAMVYGTPSHEGARQIEGEYVAPEPVARILNNYLSPGLREKSALFRSYLGIANLMNQAQLGFSAFHLGFTSIDVATSKMALGIYQIMHGNPVKGLASIAQTPTAPFTTIVRGNKMLKEWYKPGSQGALIGELADAMERAGGRAKMDSFYQTQLVKNMRQAWRAGNVIGAIARLPGAAMEAAAWPIMQYVVPRQKAGVFADLAQYELEKLGTNASDPDVQAALARAWDSVDNRLGQLVYDNLFWDKTVKDLAMGSVRSVGWNLGTVRELGGAVPDAAKFAGGKGDFTPRMAYAIALPFIAGLMGAIAYYLWHGHAPRHLKDYFFPTDSHGHRWALPTYIKDLYEYATNPVGTLEGKVHPALALIFEMLQNRDFYEKPIMHRHDPAVKKAEELAEFGVKQFVPLAYRSKPGHKPSAEERALGFFGVRPAPKSLDQRPR